MTVFSRSQPGAASSRRGSRGRPMKTLPVIATAGGLTPYANKKKIYILRGEPGKQKKIPFDYKAALKGDNKQLDVSLLPGDTIVIP